MQDKMIDGVRVNEENIIRSLKIIKQVCDENNSECVKCPFSIVRDYSCTCGITDLEPCNWKVLEYKKFQALG